jgi:hypothetical protein
VAEMTESRGKTFEVKRFVIFFFNLRIVGVESKLAPLGTVAIYCPIVPAPGDCEDGELLYCNSSIPRSLLFIYFSHGLRAGRPGEAGVQVPVR